MNERENIMSTRMWVFALAFSMLGAANLSGQTGVPRELRKGFSAPEEIVSLSQSTSFNTAIDLFNELSKKYRGKVLVDPDKHSGAIGLNIDRMPWLTALELILKHNDLWYEEYADYIKIISLNAAPAELSAAEQAAEEKFETREVAISAIFFEADISKLQQAGMSWNLFRGKDVNLGISNNSANDAGGLVELNINPNLDFGEISATFKALESDKVGEVIASPQVTVGSGEEGRIQVGSDIAITLQDFAGNAITQFISTGSIIKVRPKVIVHDSVRFIDLKLDIERSNSSRGGEAGGLEIKKSLAQTSVLLLDGEETIIGGLYVNEETRSRQGVPLLKDLPWWLFGLRYVFGYESKGVVKKELLILIRAELLPTLEDRFRAKLEGVAPENLLQKERDARRRQMDSYREQLHDR